MNNEQEEQIDNLVKFTIMPALLEDVCKTDLDAELNTLIEYLIEVLKKEQL